MHSFITPHPPPLPASPDVLLVTPDTSIGIDRVRQIQAFLARRPLQSPHNTIIISSAHLLTLPAQHALLKTLEEPPGQAQIFLVTSHPDLLLPTVISRCQTLFSPPPSSSSIPDSLPAAEKLLPQLLSATVGQRLLLLSSSTSTRDQFLSLLGSLEFLLHSRLRSFPPSHSSHLFRLIHSTRTYLKANCNLKLISLHFALHLPPANPSPSPTGQST